MRHVRPRSALLAALVLLSPLPLAACGGSDGGSDSPTTIVMMTEQQMDELQERVRKAVEENGYGSTTAP